MTTYKRMIDDITRHITIGYDDGYILNLIEYSYPELTSKYDVFKLIYEHRRKITQSKLKQIKNKTSNRSIIIPIGYENIGLLEGTFDFNKLIDVISNLM